MRIRWKALPGLLGLIASYLVSPAALSIVPAQYAWILALVSGVITVLTPALVTDRPPTDKVALATHKRLKKAGLAKAEKLPDIDRQ